jgi:predicted PurR-regulated permease PerM
MLYLLKDVVIILLFAIVLASAVSPFATWLEKKGIPRLFSVLMLYLLVFGLMLLVSSLVIPSISQDISKLTSVFPTIIQKLSSSLDNVQSGTNGYFDFVGEIQNVLDFMSGYLQQFSQSALSLVVNIFGGFFSFVAIIVISFYLSVMKNGIENFLQSIIPKRHEEYAISLWKRSEVKLGRWLQGQMLLGLIVGLIVYVGLSIMGVNFALVSGILAMLLEIVPVAGPVLAAIPAITLAFIQDPTLGLWVIVFYTVVQQIENHLLVPIVLGKSTGLNPIVVILALLIGGNLAGISGGILAVPVAAVVVEIFDDLAKHKHSNS